MNIQEALRELRNNDLKEAKEITENISDIKSKITALRKTLAGLTESDESLNEDVESSMPTQPLSVDQVKDYILNIPEASANRPPVFFKLGYVRELTNEIPSKYRGGRGSADQPKVRIFKFTEYSKLYTGADWKGTNATKQADKILGNERHTGERTGFSFAGDDAVANRIGTYRDGSEALQAYIADDSKQKVKFFISINDADLTEATKEEVAEYLTGAAAAKLLSGSSKTAAGYDDAGNAVYDKPINRFKLNNIYMIGNLGYSIM